MARLVSLFYGWAGRRHGQAREELGGRGAVGDEAQGLEGGQ